MIVARLTTTLAVATRGPRDGTSGAWTKAHGCLDGHVRKAANAPRVRLHDPGRGKPTPAVQPWVRAGEVKPPAASIPPFDLSEFSAWADSRPPRIPGLQPRSQSRRSATTLLVARQRRASYSLPFVHAFSFFFFLLAHQFIFRSFCPLMGAGGRVGRKLEPQRSSLTFHLKLTPGF